jgi:hypothetical protein
MTTHDEELASLTKDQIVARIQADPDFQKEQAERARTDFEQSLANASRPLLEELAAIGIATPSVWHNHTEPTMLGKSWTFISDTSK